MTDQYDDVPSGYHVVEDGDGGERLVANRAAAPLSSRPRRVSAQQLSSWLDWISRGNTPPIGVASVDVVLDLRDARLQLDEQDAAINRLRRHLAIAQGDLAELRANLVPAGPRDAECVALWPECRPGAYDPRCCRFPKSCTPYPTGLHAPNQESP